MQPSRQKKRVLLITNIPSPYRIPLFNELNAQLAEAGFDLKVVFGAASYSRRKWKVDLSDCDFEYVVLTSGTVQMGKTAERTMFVYGGLYAVIRAYAPDVCVVGGFSVATVKLWLLSLLGKVKYLIWAGSIHREGLDARWRVWQRKVLARGAAGGIAYGTKARAYLQQLGIKGNAIYIAINTVDVEFFHRRTEEIRQQLAGQASVAQLLYIGHLTKGKRIDLLLHLVKQLGAVRDDFGLTIVGDGPELEALRRLAEQLGIESLIRFEGFRQREDLPDYLARASCFLFPSSYDIWGLVLNEAMAAGVPCLASVHAGATCDLIEDGVTGYAVDFSDMEPLMALVNQMLDQPEHARQIGRQARCFIAEQASLRRSAEGMVQGVLHTCV